ncbi:MAG: ABC transporter substrate-binding protein, partial [Acidobacteriota bacterium]
FKAAAGPRPPVRIASLALGTDEILVSLVEPGRIIALSRYAPRPEVSNVADVAKRLPAIMDRGAEPLIALRPDLVLAARYSNAELKALLREAAIPVIELSEFKTVEDIESNLRTIGAAVGSGPVAESLIGEMRRKLEAASRKLNPSRKRWRCLYLAPGNWTAGTDTTIHAILSSAGLANVAAQAGLRGHAKIDKEQVVRLNPDLVVIGTGYERDRGWQEQLLSDGQLASVAAVQEKRIVLIPSRLLLTTSHFLGDAALILVEKVNDLPK